MDWKPLIYDTISEKIGEFFDPESIVDIGCGNGVLLRNFEGFGIEGSETGVSICQSRGLDVEMHDLRLPLPSELIQDVDLVVSIEVAEHLEPQYADVFVDTLCAYGVPVVLTASPKVEVYHYNAQPKRYWIEKMAVRGFELNECGLQKAISQAIPKYYDYLWKNMMVFNPPK